MKGLYHVTATCKDAHMGSQLISDLEHLITIVAQKKVTMLLTW